MYQPGFFGRIKKRLLLVNTFVKSLQSAVVKGAFTMKQLSLLIFITTFIACAPIEPLPDKQNQYIYDDFRFEIIDLFKASEIAKDMALIYAGTADNFHLIIALPRDKFNFQKREFYVIGTEECSISPTYLPEQNLFYNFNKVELWKALSVRPDEGVCMVTEERYLKDLF